MLYFIVHKYYIAGRTTVHKNSAAIASLWCMVVMGFRSKLFGHVTRHIDASLGAIKMAESEEEVDVLVQRVVKDITNAFKRNPNM